MIDPGQARRRRRRTRVAMASILTVVVALCVGAGFAAVKSHWEHGNGDGGPSSAVSNGVDLSARELTLQMGRQIWDDYTHSRDEQNAPLFEASTCAGFLHDDLAQRGLTTVEQLLNAYDRAKQYVPVQSIENATPTTASGTAPTGTMSVQATVTDNRDVPPTTTERAIDYRMVVEDGRWRICPSIDPV